MNVVVFQWPWGMAATTRSPRGARPKRRAMFVRAQVSSRKTSRSAISPGCSLRQVARAAATSGRSCSAAWAVFFCDSAPEPEESRQASSASPRSLGGQQDAKLVNGDVAILHHQSPNAIAMGSQFRFLPATVFIGFDRAPLLPTLHQLHNKADAHIKLLRRRIARGPRFNNSNNSFHEVWAPTPFARSCKSPFP